jgi:hypothetical protein
MDSSLRMLSGAARRNCTNAERTHRAFLEHTHEPDVGAAGGLRPGNVCVARTRESPYSSLWFVRLSSKPSRAPRTVRAAALRGIYRDRIINALTQRRQSVLVACGKGSVCARCEASQRAASTGLGCAHDWPAGAAMRALAGCDSDGPICHRVSAGWGGERPGLLRMGLGRRALRLSKRPKEYAVAEARSA